MADLQRCYFPILEGSPDSSTIWHSISVPFHDTVDFHSMSEQLDVSPLSLLQMAWAVLLRCYLGSDSLTFGCATLEKMIDRNKGNGDFDGSVHLSPCRVELGDNNTILATLKAISGDTQATIGLEKADSSTEPVKDGPAVASSFNTALLYRNAESRYSILTQEFPIATATCKLSKVS